MVLEEPLQHTSYESFLVNLLISTSMKSLRSVDAWLLLRSVENTTSQEDPLYTQEIHIWSTLHDYLVSEDKDNLYDKSAKQLGNLHLKQLSPKYAISLITCSHFQAYSM